MLKRPSPERIRRLQQDLETEDEYVKTDPVLVMIQSKDTREILQQIRIAAAVEAAAVKFERLQRPVCDRERAKISSRRVKLLAEVARLTVLMAHEEVGTPSRESMSRIVAYFWETVWDAAGQVLPLDDVERLKIACEKRVKEGSPPPGTPTIGLSPADYSPTLGQ